MAMTLLQQIRDEAVGKGADLAVILRKCRVLAQRLRNEEFKHWVDCELNGYPSLESVPDYRHLKHCISCGNFISPVGHQLSNAQIPVLKIPEEFRKYLTEMKFPNSIVQLQDDIRQANGGVLRYAWPPDLSRVLSNNFYPNFGLLEAWQAVPVSVVTRILDTIRNRVLNFVLDIESENPNAGEAIMSEPPVPPEKVDQIFHTHIYGNVGNIATGSHTFSQNASVNVLQNDFKSLAEFIKSIGGADEDCRELEQAIEADGQSVGKGFGKRVAGWLGGMVTKAAQGMLKVSGDVIAKVISEKLRQYYCV